MKHCFFDAETLGQNMIDCAVIDVSMFVADTDQMLSNEPYDLSTINQVTRYKLSIKDQVDNYQFVVYQDTVDFWQSQSDAARRHIAPKRSDLTVSQFCEQLISDIDNRGKINYWWSRSNAFDPILLWRLFNTQGKRQHFDLRFPYWSVRDIRTFIDAKLDFPKLNPFVPVDDKKAWEDSFVKHDSSWDVLADVLRMQKIIRIENDL